MAEEEAERARTSDVVKARSLSNQAAVAQVDQRARCVHAAQQ